MRHRNGYIFVLTFIFSLILTIQAFPSSVFSVVGTVRNSDGTLADNGLEISVNNETRNLTNKCILGTQETGKYSVVFLDTGNKTVGAEGDIIKVTIKDSAKVVASATYILNSNDIAKYMAIINLEIGKFDEKEANPDLTIKSLDFYQEDTDIFRIQVEITNIGNANASDVQVKFFGEGILIGEDLINVPAGKVNYAKAKWQLPGRKTENYKLSIKITSSNPPEQNISNNEVNKTISAYYVDSGKKDDPFKVTEDGYSFPNWGMEPEDLKDNFLSWCRDQNLSDKVLRVLLFANPMMVSGIKGHCYGMATTSILYRDYPHLKPVNKETYDMKKEDPGVVGKIRVYHAAGGLPATLELIWTKLFGGYNISEEYRNVFDCVVNQNKPILQVLSYKDRLKFGSHAIAGYMILDLGDEKRVYVYENELPGSKDIYVKYNLLQRQVEIYDYDLVLSRYPFTDREKLRWIIRDLWTDFIQSLKANGQTLFFIGSPAYMTATDNLGRRVGLVDGNVINEIPGASIEKFGDAHALYVPNDLSYKIETIGNDTGTMTLDIIDTVTEETRQISYENVPVVTGSKTIIHFTPDSPDFTMSVDNNGDGVIEEERLPDSVVSTDEVLTVEERPWDVNSDGVVDILDLKIVVEHFGESPPVDPRADVNGDGIVDILDLVLVGRHFGEKYR